MLHKLAALSLFATTLFAANAARADWIIVSGQDFQPYEKDTAYKCSGGRGCYVSSGFTSVMAPVRIPIGKTFKSLYCQVLDVSTTKDVSFSLTELLSTDDSTSWGNRTLMSLSSVNAPGHVKISTNLVSAPATTRTFECSGAICSYYSYYLFASLPGTSNTNVKSCAIEYQ